MTAELNTPQFDVFLSHSSVDKAWVIRLKDDLLRYDVSVWLDKDEIRPGDLFAKALEQALDNCRTVALIVSPGAITSGWVEEEYYRALSLAKTKRTTFQLIPVLLRDAELPGFLGGRNWVDFQDETAYAENVWRLVWGITGQRPAQILDVPTSSNLPGKSQRVKKLPETFIYTRRPAPFSNFVGRQHEVDTILGRLANLARGSSAISGDSQVGRTSLLHYLREPQVYEARGLSSDWCHFLYLNCYSIVPFSEAAFWHHVLLELALHLRIDETLSERVQRLLAQASPDSFDLNALFDHIGRAGRLVVLLLDEFEWVVENLDQSIPGLLYHLRALLNRPERGLALVVASRVSLKQLCARFRFAGSPFDNSFSAMTLLPFGEVEVDELLTRYQVDFSSDERAYLRQVAGTHPYLIQLAASLIVQARGRYASIEALFTQVETDLEHETESYFTDLFDYSSEPEKMLLALLALYQLSQQLPVDQVRLGDLAKVFGRYDREMTRLIKRGLVLNQPDGPKLFSPIFYGWVLHEVIIVQSREVLSGWEPYYADFLSLVQKETLKNLVDKIVKRPAIIRSPELLAQAFAQNEVSQSSASKGEQILGRYVIELLIGGGGMADIFKARHLHLDRVVAIKKLRAALSNDEEVRARFLQEAQAVARLRHPHIVQIYDFGIQDNHYYMVMDFIEGYDLKEHLHHLRTDGQSLPFGEVIRIAIAIGEALDYAHQHAMIHRDVKPANILLTNDGGVFLTDFGMVRLIGQSGLTETGGFVGTLAYMAPEQMVGQSQDMDHRVDIYALGCVVYEMITGRLPFEQADFPLAHLNRDPPAPDSIVPDLPKAASQVILKALAKDPVERPASASQFIEELRRALSG